MALTNSFAPRGDSFVMPRKLQVKPYLTMVLALCYLCWWFSFWCSVVVYPFQNIFCWFARCFCGDVELLLCLYGCGEVDNDHVFCFVVNEGYECFFAGNIMYCQVFRVECNIPKLKINAHGEAASRRSAEQQAAELAYNKINASKSRHE